MLFNILCLKVPRLCPLVLSVTPVLRQRWIHSINGMIMTKENRSTLRDTYPSATLPTTNPTRTALKLNPVIQSDRPVTIYWSHRMTFKVWWLTFVCFIYKTLVHSSQRKQFVDKMQSSLILQYVAFILITGLWKV